MNLEQQKEFNLLIDKLTALSNENDVDWTDRGPYLIDELQRRWEALEGCVIYIWHTGTVEQDNQKRQYSLRDVRSQRPDVNALKQRLWELQSLQLPWVKEVTDDQ